MTNAQHHLGLRGRTGTTAKCIEKCQQPTAKHHISCSSENDSSVSHWQLSASRLWETAQLSHLVSKSTDRTPCCCMRYLLHNAQCAHSCVLFLCHAAGCSTGTSPPSQQWRFGMLAGIGATCSLTGVMCIEFILAVAAAGSSHLFQIDDSCR